MKRIIKEIDIEMSLDDFDSEDIIEHIEKEYDIDIESIINSKHKSNKSYYQNNIININDITEHDDEKELKEFSAEQVKVIKKRHGGKGKPQQDKNKPNDKGEMQELEKLEKDAGKGDKSKLDD